MSKRTFNVSERAISYLNSTKVYVNSVLAAYVSFVSHLQTLADFSCAQPQLPGHRAQPDHQPPARQGDQPQHVSPHGHARRRIHGLGDHEREPRFPFPHPCPWKLTWGSTSARTAHPLDRVREQRHRAQVDAGDDGQHRRGIGSWHRLRARTKCPPGSGCCGSRRQARRTWTVPPAFPLYSFIMVDLCVARIRGEVYIDNLSGLCPPSHPWGREHVRMYGEQGLLIRFTWGSTATSFSGRSWFRRSHLT